MHKILSWDGHILSSRPYLGNKCGSTGCSFSRFIITLFKFILPQTKLHHFEDAKTLSLKGYWQKIFYHLFTTKTAIK